MEEIPVMMPRFIFVHRVNVSSVPENEVPAFLESVKNTLKGSERLPMIEYFIPVREGSDYQLTIVDLTTFAVVNV